MKKVLLAISISGLAAAAVGGTDSAELENAWLAFNNARGAAALIQGDREHPSANDIFRVIPDVSLKGLNEDKLQLGFDLFNDPRLSRDGTIACSSCHVAMLGGVDRRPVPSGIDGAQGEFNAPDRKSVV